MDHRHEQAGKGSEIRLRFWKWTEEERQADNTRNKEMLKTTESIWKR